MSIGVGEAVESVGGSDHHFLGNSCAPVLRYRGEVMKWWFSRPTTYVRANGNYRRDP